MLHAQDAHCLQHAKGPHGIGLCRVFGHVERDFDVALSRQVVYLVGTHLLDDAYQRAGVCHVAVMEVNQTFLLHVSYPLVKIQVLYSARIEGRRAAQDAVHLVSLLQKELGKERSVLSRYSRYQSYFHQRLFFRISDLFANNQFVLSRSDAQFLGMAQPGEPVRIGVHHVEFVLSAQVFVLVRVAQHVVGV